MTTKTKRATTQQIKTKRPGIRRIFEAVSLAVMDAKINPQWHNLGKLLDAMSSLKRYDDVVSWICIEMHQRDVTRSCFVTNFFKLLHLPAVSAVAQNAYDRAKQRRSAGRRQRRPAAIRRR